ncbi:MAG: ATP-binding cassette domain-containing protein [Chloroflexi bacterium]|nr:ATP-binding cassette domain-containing protein [Chloroflexota bacterium]
MQRSEALGSGRGFRGAAHAGLDRLRDRLDSIDPRYRLALLAIAVLAVPFVLQNAYLVRLAGTIGIYIMLAIGLNVVVGYAGLLDLGYVAFYAVGAYMYAFLASPQYGLHLPFLLVLPIGALIAALFGMLLGYPVLRLRGDYLAIVTMGFGEIIRILLVNLAPVTGGPNGIRLIDPANIFGLNLSQAVDLGALRVDSVVNYYYLTMLFAAGCLLAVSRLNDSKIGRAWQAIRDDEIAAQCMGVHKSNLKLLAFATGAFLAGVAGVIFASWQQFVSPETFTIGELITIFCMIVLGGAGRLRGVVVGAIVLVVLPEFLREYSIYRMVIYGAVLVLIMRYRPQGLLGRGARWSAKKRQVTPASSISKITSSTKIEGPPGCTPDDVPMLEVDNLSKAFGGLQAVQGLTFTVRQGEIVSIIGPNGAGKTTVFNLISGLYRPSAGSIKYLGRPIVGVPPHKLAEMGIVRTFQNLRLFADMTVLENVMVGLHCMLKAGLLSIVLKTASFRRDEEMARAKAVALLGALGHSLIDRRDDIVLTLTYADRRRVEICRALACGPRLLLLDEPVAGMTSAEAQEMTSQIRLLRDAGYTVLLIEHHMNVVMGISDRIIVLDQGAIISEGTPEMVQNDERVIEAYLGRRRSWGKAAN